MARACASASAGSSSKSLHDKSSLVSRGLLASALTIWQHPADSSWFHLRMSVSTDGFSLRCSAPPGGVGLRCRVGTAMRGTNADRTKGVVGMGRTPMLER